MGKTIIALVFILACVSHNSVKAQFGIGGRYATIQDGYWTDVLGAVNSDLENQLASVGVLYWFRLKQKRIEFLPEAGAYWSLNTYTNTGPSNTLTGLYAQVNIDVYFLDFGSDCNCPTFSKQGDLLKRGLFVEVSPGVEFRKFEVGDGEFNRAVPRFYGGLGFDIGISDLLTVTPTVGMSILTGSAWDGLEEFLDIDGSIFDQHSRNRDVVFNAGLRVLFRPDYTRKRF